MDILTTPVAKKPRDLGRASLLRSASQFPSPMRKSMNSKSPATPVVLLERQNEETERLRRRSVLTMQKRVSNISSTNASPLVELSRAMNKGDVVEHLQICTKLHSENRISVKNAWELYIIDVLRHITLTDTSGNQMQVASTSLDIGSKVYGIRVDDVHMAGLKLASSMSKQGGQGTADAIDDANEDDGKGNKKEKRKRQIVKKNTIDREGTSLFGTLQKMESVFFSTRENIELSATENLLTLKLPMHPSGHRFMAMSKETYWITKPDISIQKIAEKTNNQIKLPQIVSFYLCEPFRDFDTEDWDPDQEEQLCAEKSQNFNNDVVLDERGLPIPELDGSIHNIFEDDNGADELMSEGEELQQQEDALQVQMHGEIALIVDAVPEDYRVPTEYGYNALLRTSAGKMIDKIWAGPSHWKVKYLRTAPARYSGTVVQPQVKTVKKKPKPVEQLKFVCDFEGLDSDEKVTIKKVLPAASTDKITLPVPNIHIIDKKNFRALINKDVIPATKSEMTEKDGESDVQVYNYDNPNDSQYCSQNSVGGDDGGGDFPDNDSGQEEGVALQENFLGEHLINAPDTVAKSTISYALRAKKMDMKKLKAAIWQNLTHKTPNMKQPESYDGDVQSTSFSKIYESLPGYINNDMKNELSCSLAFVALLHLCNEQNLKLIQDPTYKDFQIHKVNDLV